MRLGKLDHYEFQVHSTLTCLGKLYYYTFKVNLTLTSGKLCFRWTLLWYILSKLYCYTFSVNFTFARLSKLYRYRKMGLVWAKYHVFYLQNGVFCLKWGVSLALDGPIRNWRRNIFLKILSHYLESLRECPNHLFK